jgi:hypothetical protein
MFGALASAPPNMMAMWPPSSLLLTILNGPGPLKAPSAIESCTLCFNSER